jgi:hypothetical protein
LSLKIFILLSSWLIKGFEDLAECKVWILKFRNLDTTLLKKEWSKIFFKTRTVSPRSGQHVEELVKTFVEGVVPYANPPLTDLLGPLLVEKLSIRFLDAYSSYCSTNRLYFD